MQLDINSILFHWLLWICFLSSFIEYVTCNIFLWKMFSLIPFKRTSNENGNIFFQFNFYCLSGLFAWMRIFFFCFVFYALHFYFPFKTTEDVRKDDIVDKFSYLWLLLLCFLWLSNIKYDDNKTIETVCFQYKHHKKIITWKKWKKFL